MENKMTLTMPIEHRIFMIREQKVILDADLAVIYGVSTKALNQAVKRNSGRFPGDFMFKMTPAELKYWRSQFVTSNTSLRMGLRRPPYVFTEHGALMVANLLKSPTAVQMSVFVIRAFIKMRAVLEHNKDLARKLAALESKYDDQFRVVFDAIRELMEKPEKAPLHVHGFRQDQP